MGRAGVRCMSQPQDKIERVVAAFKELSESVNALSTPDSPLQYHFSVLSTDISKAWSFFRVFIHPHIAPHPPVQEAGGADDA